MDNLRKAYLHLILSRSERAALLGRAFDADTARQVQTCGQRIGLLWSETLRYHNNLAYPFEVTQVRLATEWLLANLSSL